MSKASLMCLFTSSKASSPAKSFFESLSLNLNSSGLYKRTGDEISFFFLRSPRYIVYSQNLRAALIISITLSKVANSFLRDNRKRANVR